MSNPLQLAITEKFDILKKSLTDDINCIESILKAKEIYLNSLSSNIKNEPALYVIHPCFRAELKDLEINISFLKGFLRSLRAIFDNVELNNREFQSNLKEYFKEDSKLENDDKLKRIRKSALFNRNKPLIEESINLAVRAINDCVSEIKTEKMRLHVKYSEKYKINYSKSEDDSLWDNINVNAFMKLLEDEVGLNFDVDSSFEFKGKVKYKDWLLWKEGVLILFSDALLIVPESLLLNDINKKVENGGLQYKLDKITVKSINDMKIEVTKKNASIFSSFLGLAGSTIKFEEGNKDDFIKYLKPTVY